MLKTSFVPLDREQFAKLREAKRLIQQEFEQELKLQDKEVLDQLYGFSLESKDERLFDIFSELHNSQEAKRKARTVSENVVAGGWEKSEPAEKPKAKSRRNLTSKDVKVGDVVDGQRCTGFYRGTPIFEKVG